jgi:hypothetical protein
VEATREQLSSKPDRADLATLTKTLSTLSGCRGIWEAELGEWNVETSPFLDEFRLQASLKTLRATVRRLAEKTFGKAPTKRQQGELAEISDLARLERISDRILDAKSWTDLLATP